MTRKKHNRMAQEHKKAAGTSCTKAMQAAEKPWVKAYREKQQA